MKKVGIYSGSFDPIHEGHLAFARQAITHSKLDKVFFLVEPTPRRKQGVKALEHRAAMVRLAIQDDPKLGLIRLEHMQFTVAETLPFLQTRFKGAQLYFLMGDDFMAHINHWPHVKDLIRSVYFIVGLRSSSKHSIESKLTTLQRTRGATVNYELLQSSYPDYASTPIRLAIKRGQEPIGLPPKVREYIAEQGLYTSSS